VWLRVTVEVFSGGSFAENGYLVRCEESNRAAVVDPGGAAEGMVARLEEWGAELEAILLTHAHLDHVEGIPRIRAYAPDVPIHLHEDDLPLYYGVPQQAAAFGLSVGSLPDPDARLEAGQEIRVGESVRFEVRFTPGHSPGHVILVSEGDGLALVGDVIFRGSIGRTDLPGGDLKTLMTSIRQQVLTLPDDTRLLSGHGPETTVELERVGNPFLVPSYLGHFA
jgi:hydroxyacylglutathione hydrolase